MPTSRWYSRACSMASAARSAISWSRLSFSRVNSRSRSVPTSITPLTRPSTISGTPSSALTCLPSSSGATA
jgi:hypothetical protein